MRRRLRDLVDPVPAARREHPLLSGAILLAVLAFVVYCGVTRQMPFLSGQSGTLVQAVFAQANFIDNQTPVRVGGVDVGSVSAVRLEPRRNLALVTMRITNQRLVVKRDALAAIRWRTLLGGTFYIDLNPGSPSAPPLGDRTIPAADTSSQVEFDDLDQVFGGGTANGPRVFLRETRTALAERRGVGAALGSLNATTPTIAAGLAPLRGRQSDDLRRLVGATAVTFDSLGSDTSALRGLVTGAQGTFAVTDAERRALGQLLERSPGALDSTSITMQRVDQTLTRLDPLVRALRPGAAELGPATATATPTLSTLRTLLADAKPLLSPLDRALASLGQASASGTPLMQDLTPTLARLGTQIDPWLARRDPTTGMRTYEALGPTLAAIDSGASELDGEGYWLHFPTQTDLRSIVLSLPGASGPTPANRLCARPGINLSRCASVIAVLDRVFGGQGRR